MESLDRKFNTSRMDGSALINVISAIIIVLAVFILIGPLFRVKESARRAECLNNLKQIGLALKSYAVDNSGTFPWQDDIAPYCRSFGKLNPAYISDLTKLTCPSSNDTRLTKQAATADKEPFSEDECRTSLSYAYGHNKQKPWTETANETTRIATDKYADYDYSANPFPKNKPFNHPDRRKFWGKGFDRPILHLDGSVRWDNKTTPVEADPEWDIKVSKSVKAADYKPLVDSEPEKDQTGADWWSDPPEKK